MPIETSLLSIRRKNLENGGNSNGTNYIYIVFYSSKQLATGMVNNTIMGEFAKIIFFQKCESSKKC